MSPTRRNQRELGLMRTCLRERRSLPATASKKQGQLADSPARVNLASACVSLLFSALLFPEQKIRTQMPLSISQNKHNTSLDTKLDTKINTKYTQIHTNTHKSTQIQYNTRYQTRHKNQYKIYTHLHKYNTSLFTNTQYQTQHKNYIPKGQKKKKKTTTKKSRYPR